MTCIYDDNYHHVDEEEEKAWTDVKRREADAFMLSHYLLHIVYLVATYCFYSTFKLRNISMSQFKHTVIVST